MGSKNSKRNPMSDYRIDIKDSDYPDPYDEEPKRKFHYRPVPNYLREYIKRRENVCSRSSSTTRKRT